MAKQCSNVNSILKIKLLKTKVLKTNLLKTNLLKVVVLMFSFLLIISSCAQDSKVIKNEKIKVFAIDSNELTIENMINSGQYVHRIKLGQFININSHKNVNKWNLSLGKRDIKFIVFDYFKNGLQKSARFTKIGEYQVRLGSHQSGRQMTTMMHSLTIEVEN